MKLQLRHEINEQLFDQLMRQSHAPAYTYTWYLDAVCGQWAALVFGDYEAVFILPQKKKWGFTYLMQPDFCQQLGLWGKNTSPEMLQQCMDFVQKKYLYGVIQLPKIGTQNHQFQVSERNNFVLDLDTKPPIYATNHTRNLKKAQKNGIYTQKIDLEACVNFFRINKGNELNLTDANYKNLRNLLIAAQKNNALQCHAAYTQAQKLVAIAVYICTQNEAIYILSAADSEGKNGGAAFLLVHNFITQNKFLRLNFEGSDKPNLARFYGGFGAVLRPYSKVWWSKFNLNLFKKR